MKKTIIKQLFSVLTLLFLFSLESSSFNYYPLKNASEVTNSQVVNNGIGAYYSATLIANQISTLITNDVLYVNVLDNDTSVAMTINTTPIVDAPNNGTISIAPSGLLTYTPTVNFSGYDTVVVSVCAGLTCYNDTTFITVQPKVLNDTAMSVMGQIINGTLAGNNAGTSLVYNIIPVLTPSNGSLTLTPAGSYTYTPNIGFNGLDTVVINVCDGSVPSQCKNDTLLIKVIPNHTPIANKDVVIVTEDIAKVIVVLINDTDVDNNLDIKSVVVTQLPKHGIATVDTLGNITYTPITNYNGVDTLIYNVCDKGMPVLCDTAMLIITVTSVNDAPIAVRNDVTTKEDSSFTFNVLNNDTDVDGIIDTLNVSIVKLPNYGTATANFNGTITYVPNSNYSGIDTLIYRYCDNGIPQKCDTALVIITVTAVNDAPVAIVDNVITNEDTPIIKNVLTNDTDVDNNLNPKSVVVTQAPKHGIAIVDTLGNITYTPTTNYNGVDTLIYNVCDKGTPVLCDTAMLIISVTSVNDAPIAVRNDVTTKEDSTFRFNVLGNDTDIDGVIVPLNVTIVDAPNHGTATANSDGTITYTPNPNFNGIDTLIYRYCDNGTPQECDTALVIITVTAVNDPLVANFDNATATEDTPIVINVLSNDTDVDGVIIPANVTVTTQPTNGTVSVNLVTGAITYTPNANYNGADVLVYTLCDNAIPQQCDTAIVYITINAVPDLVNDTASVAGGGAVIIPIFKNDLGVEGLTPTVIVQPQHGTFDPITGVYTPNDGYVGNDVLIYMVCNVSVCDTAIVIIKVIQPQYLFIPEGFSPNGDGVNDMFVIKGIQTYPNNTITLFNRWGNIVYEATNYQNDWNGSSNKGLTIGGEALPVGTYFYILNLGVDARAPIKGYVYMNK